jgi:hypothetical protein
VRMDFNSALQIVFDRQYDFSSSGSSGVIS